MKIHILNSFIEFSAENLKLRHTIKNGLNIAVNLREALKEHEAELMPMAKESVTVVLDTPYMLVPEDELKGGEETKIKLADKMFRAAITTSPSDVVLRTGLSSFQCVLIYTIDSDLKVVIEDNFPKHCFIHSFESLLPSTDGEGLKVRLSNKNIDIFAIHQNRFRFANRFPLQSDDDTIFLILSVWKQLSLSQLKDILIIYGETENAPEELMGKLHQFIEKIEYKRVDDL